MTKRQRMTKQRRQRVAARRATVRAIEVRPQDQRQPVRGLLARMFG